MSDRRRRSIRLAARRLLRLWLAPTFQKSTGRIIGFEPLENRQLMAADFFSNQSLDDNSLEMNDGSSDLGASAQSTPGLQAEGEAQNDLVAFAKALRDAGVQFFGAAWCPHCNAQKQLFEDGAKYLPFIEVTNPDRTPNSIGISENVTEYPTWEFQDGSRLTGEQSLATLSQRSGIAIPTSSSPTFDTIANQTVLTGSPLHVPVDAYDPNGNPLTISVTSSNPSVISAEVLSGNQSLRMSTNGFGDMVFELFDTEVPGPANRVIQLANSGFYNQTGSSQIIFHRVINNFVIQAGDPTGTGAGGSTLGDFDDQFDVDLQHNRTGILSFAKSTDDTNDSQFFITEGPQRHLDFNHSIFGQLVEGEPVREAISNTAVNNSRPTTDVVINSMSVFNDTENGMVRLKAVGNQTGSATITVTVTDSEGNSTAQAFVATVEADTTNTQPFLNPIAPVSTFSGVPVNIQLSAQDVEGDAVFFDASNTTAVNYQLSVNNTTGLVTVTPPADFVGTLSVFVGVRPAGTQNTESLYDRQTVSVTVSPITPTSIDLVSASDTGSSTTDNITNAGSLTFSIGGTVNGATVELLSGTTVIGTAVASGTTTTITTSNLATLGSGTYSLVARQRIDSVQSSNSPSLQIIYDAIAPTAVPASAFPASIPAGQPLSLDLTHSEEGQGLAYALQNAETGMSIASGTGVFLWTPTTAQQGSRSLDLILTDKAGNESTQTVAINVAASALVGVQLRIVDLSNNPLTSVSIGQSFKVQVFVEDLRTPTAEGVFSAYLDLVYDNAHVELDGANPITRGTTYTNTPTVSTTTLGLIDELGAFAGTTSPVGEGPFLLAEVRLRATTMGQANFSTNDAEATGSQVLLFGVSSEIESDRVAFGSASLAVGINFQVANDVFNFNEDTSNNSLNVLNNDTITSGSGTVLNIHSVSSPSAGGSVTIASGGQSLLYTPAANYNGGETFTYTVRDQNGVEATASVSVQVQPVNDAPIVANDSYQVTLNTTQNFLAVLQNDHSGPDTNETISVTSVGTPSQGGSVTVGAAGANVLYTPKTGFVGTETFTYVATDSFGGTASGIVTVTVENLVPPVGVNDSFTVAEDAATASFNVLANDTAGETGQTLSVLAVNAPTGTATVASNGLTINYAPAANFNGTELVAYTVRASNGAAVTATATFTVTAVNDAPNAVDDAVTVISGVPTTTLSVLANDLNVDTGETMTITAVTQPPSGQGTLAISSDSRSLIYTPASASFTGTVSFTYTIGDGNSLTDTANVLLTASNYVPRSISGTIDTDSSLFAGFLQLDSARLSLAGTNYLDQAVAQTVVASDGSFTVPNLAPGQYELQSQELPFFVGGHQPVEVQSNPSDGNHTGVQVNVGTLDARFIDIRDFLSNSIGRGLFVAANPGQSQQWLASQGEWRGYSNIQVSLNSDASSVQIRGTNPSNASVQATLPLNGNRVSVRGMSNGSHLLRIPLAPNQLTLTPVTTSSTASGEGEQVAIGDGFAAPAAVANSGGISNLQSSTLEGEGEGDAFATADLDQVDSSVDLAMQQVSEQMILVSPAGDFLAEQQNGATDQDIETQFDSFYEGFDDLGV